MYMLKFGVEKIKIKICSIIVCFKRNYLISMSFNFLVCKKEEKIISS